jgi:hypothetical protein
MVMPTRRPTHERSPVPRSAPQAEEQAFFTPTPTLAELAAEQGVTPIATVDDLRSDAWPPEEDVDTFLATIQRERPPAVSRDVA